MLQSGCHVLLFRMDTLYPSVTDAARKLCGGSRWRLTEFDINETGETLRTAIQLGIKPFPQIIVILDGVVIGELRKVFLDVDHLTELVAQWEREPQRSIYVSGFQSRLDAQKSTNNKQSENPR